jgi:molecular chaperone DnaK (HSP70)
MKNNNKNFAISQKDEFIYDRMQQIAGLKEGYYGHPISMGAKDNYKPSTSREERNFDEVIEVVQRVFEENGDTFSEEKKQEAIDKLQDVLSNPRSYRKEMWDNEELEQLGTSLAEEMLGV